jgi:hypothetical protein
MSEIMASIQNIGGLEKFWQKTLAENFGGKLWSKTLAPHKFRGVHRI